eukprot:1174078-Amphidinium_carterae.1
MCTSILEQLATLSHHLTSVRKEILRARTKASFCQASLLRIDCEATCLQKQRGCWGYEWHGPPVHLNGVLHGSSILNDRKSRGGLGGILVVPALPAPVDLRLLGVMETGPGEGDRRRLLRPPITP